MPLCRMAAGAVVIGMSQQVNGVQIYGTCLFAGLVRSFRRVNGGVSIVLARSRFRPAGARSFSPKMGHVEPLDIQSNRTSVHLSRHCDLFRVVNVALRARLHLIACQNEVASQVQHGKQLSIRSDLWLPHHGTRWAWLLLLVRWVGFIHAGSAVWCCPLPEPPILGE